MSSQLVISVDELWLKGRNQKNYLRAVCDHINAVIKVYHGDSFRYQVRSERLYYSSEKLFSEELLRALALLPGISYVSPCRIVKRLPEESLENVYEEVLNQLSWLDSSETNFRAMVKRVDKSFSSQTSVEIEREIGHRVITRYSNAKVELKKPKLVVDVRVLPKHVSISTKTQKGIGGLPWGTTGSALTLLSGGFDSPVASFLMAKRGIKQSFVFFHAYPFVGREVLAKIKDLTSILAKYQRSSHLYIVPFGEVQNKISQHCREEYRTLIFRRFMVEISNMICDIAGMQSLITGDCIGQVSSQTMENLHLMNLASKRMIMRPLIGLNKLEIMSIATQIGTHDVSLIPHDDACSLFAPKNPVINPSYDYWGSWDSEIDFSNVLKDAFDGIETYSVNLKGELFKKDFFSYDR